jgi:YVTN family beta-propeller protein
MTGFFFVASALYGAQAEQHNIAKADGTHAYVPNQGDGTVSVIDTARNKVVATIRVGAGPVGVDITSEDLKAHTDELCTIRTAENGRPYSM